MCAKVALILCDCYNVTIAHVTISVPHYHEHDISNFVENWTTIHSTSQPTNTEFDSRLCYKHF